MTLPHHTSRKPIGSEMVVNFSQWNKQTHPQHQKCRRQSRCLRASVRGLQRVLQRGSKGTAQTDSTTAPRQCIPRCPQVSEFVCETLKARLYHSNPYKKATEAREMVQLVNVPGPNLPAASHRPVWMRSRLASRLFAQSLSSKFPAAKLPEE